jgi:serine/threonine protein kinase
VVELATAKNPFEASDELELIQKIQEAVPSVAGADRFTSEFTAFYTSCLQKEFSRRPNYKQLLVLDFRRLLHQFDFLLFSNRPSYGYTPKCPLMSGTGIGS